MNTLFLILVCLIAGLAIGWIFRASKDAPADSRLEDELRQQAEALKADLEQCQAARLQAEAARSAADASLQAAVARARELEVEVKSTETRGDETAATIKAELATAVSDLRAAQERVSETTAALATANANLKAATLQTEALDQRIKLTENRGNEALSAAKTELSATAADLKTAQARAESLTTALATAEANLNAANERNAEQHRANSEQFRELKEGHEKALRDLREAFAAMSSDALKQLQPEFLQLANETLAKFNEGAKGDLAQRQAAIATLVKPLEEQLKVYQQRLAQSETTQATMMGEVSKHLTTLAQHSTTLSTETIQLRRVLSSGQARGRWGEETLRRVVEAAGMSAHCDFVEQERAEDGKPDLVVKLPGDRVIIVDSKVPDLDFLNALSVTDELKRGELLKAHSDKLRGTIKALAERDYPSQFPKALDHVVLFLPAESLFSAALEGDRDLIVWAAQRRVTLATPASLIALLRSVSASWLHHEQTVNAREIAEAASELFSRVATFTRHFDSIRSGLEKATNAYNDAVGSFDRSVRPSGERVLKLGVDSGGKVLTEPVLISESLRIMPAAEIAAS
ncbi:DNA recombination protein RmuC [Horticoccus luteus]|uniref:DNA recombination protein RmuC n=1 Tax=Horticoccus luteus TaxID=2862869 RepID=A0A8F9TYS3_9BACT|nr:DNA recombination protein RmuC [Horticoccus luteus]QYM80698.1 DNA recombination protein RmuC [Horticoccus luteus]